MRDTLLHSYLDVARRHAATIRGATLRRWSDSFTARPQTDGQWLVKPTTRTVFSALLFAAAYWLGALIGLSFTFQSSPISPVWPPNAILLVALLLVPMETWWVYLLAVFGAHMLAELPSGIPLTAATGFYFTNTGEAVLGALLVHRFTDGSPWLGTLRRMTVYLACAVVAAPVITSFADAAVVVLTRLGENYWLSWETRCVSNILAELTIGPALLLALTGARRWMRGASRRHWAEAVALALGLLLVGITVFGGQLTWRGSAPVLVYAILPLMLWAAVRFGTGGTSIVLLSITMLATWGAAQGYGPFSAYSPVEDVISLQLFLIGISIPMLILAALMQEHAVTKATYQESEVRFRTMANQAPVLIWMSGTDTLCTFFNTVWLTFTGRSLEQELGNGWMEGVHPDDYERCLQTYLTAFHACESFTIEYRLRRSDGDYRWVVDNGVPRFAPDGSFAGYIGSAIDITERKRLERALRTSEARYRDLVESQTEMVCRYLPDSTLTFVNEAYCRMYGKPREQLIGTRFLDHMDQPAREHHMQYTAQLLAHADTTATDEHEFLLPDGSIVWQQWVDHLIYDTEGHVIEIQGIGRDITERKRAEEALQASEVRYRTVVRDLPQTVVLLFDAELRHSFADGPGLQMLGLTTAGLEGRTVWETLPSDLAAALAPHYEAACSGQAAEMDVEHAQHIYRIQVVPMPTAPGPKTEGTAPPARTPVGMVVLRDITEQQRARDELVSERTRAALLSAISQEFRTLAEHSPDLIARFDPAGRHVYINQAGAVLLGLAPEHVVGKTLAELGLRLDDYMPWTQALQDAVATRAPRTFDIEAEAPDGQVRSLHVRFIPEFADDARTLVSVLGIATDVSALKQAEARLAEQASELEAIFEAKADGMAVYDVQGRFVRANTALRHLFGFDADHEYTARPLDERAERLLLFDEQGQVLTAEQWPHWRVLRGEILTGASAMEGRVRTVDGRELWISTTGAPMRRPDGQVSGTVLITRDVTARRALERQVAEQAAAAERNRLAHELHDTVTQEIFSAGLLADSITRNWPEHRAEAEEALAHLPGVIRGALAGLRVLLLELRPTTLEQMPLAALLRQLGEAMSNRAKVPIAVAVRLTGRTSSAGAKDGADGADGADRADRADGAESSLPTAVKVAFYRVAQEALMNAAKYAKAHAIDVHLRTRGRDRTTIELEITDDGRGFDLSAIPAGHFGLAMMRERAHAIGATMQVRSQLGQGTQVIVVWPSTAERTGEGKRRQAATVHRKPKGGTA